MADVYLPVCVSMNADGNDPTFSIDWEGTPWSAADNVWDGEHWIRDPDLEEAATDHLHDLFT